MTKKTLNKHPASSSKKLRKAKKSEVNAASEKIMGKYRIALKRLANR